MSEIPLSKAFLTISANVGCPGERPLLAPGVRAETFVAGAAGGCAGGWDLGGGPTGAVEAGGGAVGADPAVGKGGGGGGAPGGREVVGGIPGLRTVLGMATVSSVGR